MKHSPASSRTQRQRSPMTHQRLFTSRVARAISIREWVASFQIQNPKSPYALDAA